MAARKTCGGLIVVTKYKLLPFDKFQSLDKIKQVKCPVLFIHGKQDTLIAFWHGEMLFANANEPKFSFWIDEANHNNVFAKSKNNYLQAIQNFSAALTKN